MKYCVYLLCIVFFITSIRCSTNESSEDFTAQTITVDPNEMNHFNYSKLFTGYELICFSGNNSAILVKPEKIVANILNFLNLRFIPQFSKKNALWCGTYKYDFYVEHNDKKIIIETHGLQHYDERSMYFIRKDGTNQKEIDIIKRKLAKDNIDR